MLLRIFSLCVDKPRAQNQPKAPYLENLAGGSNDHQRDGGGRGQHYQCEKDQTKRIGEFTIDVFAHQLRIIRR
jgi:hypothetical protein